MWHVLPLVKSVCSTLADGWSRKDSDTFERIVDIDDAREHNNRRARGLNDRRVGYSSKSVDLLKKK